MKVFFAICPQAWTRAEKTASFIPSFTMGPYLRILSGAGRAKSSKGIRLCFAIYFRRRKVWYDDRDERKTGAVGEDDLGRGFDFAGGGRANTAAPLEFDTDWSDGALFWFGF